MIEYIKQLVPKYVYIHTCMYACMCVCMYVCMYVLCIVFVTCAWPNPRPNDAKLLGVARHVP